MRPESPESANDAPNTNTRAERRANSSGGRQLWRYDAMNPVQNMPADARSSVAASTPAATVSTADGASVYREEQNVREEHIKYPSSSPCISRSKNPTCSSGALSTSMLLLALLSEPQLRTSDASIESASSARIREHTIRRLYGARRARVFSLCFSIAKISWCGYSGINVR